MYTYLSQCFELEPSYLPAPQMWMTRSGSSNAVRWHLPQADIRAGDRREPPVRACCGSGAGTTAGGRVHAAAGVLSRRAGQDAVARGRASASCGMRHAPTRWPPPRPPMAPSRQPSSCTMWEDRARTGGRRRWMTTQCALRPTFTSTSWQWTFSTFDGK